MNYMNDASTFERSFLQKARQQHIPITGALELLPLCNMNCDMCYVRLSRSEMECQGQLRTVDEWILLAQQMQKAGTLFLLLTGGEPLARKGCPQLIRMLKEIPGMEKILGDAFAKAFKNKKVMVRYAYEFKDYEFGIYWDSWSQPQEIVRGYEEMKKLGDRWKTQPIGGEITWNWGDLARFKSFEEVVADKDTREYVMEQIRNLHCNHLGGITWADFNEPEFRKNAEILQKAMGYRFIINEFSYPKEIKVGAQFPISFKVVNSGSSPFYYNWPVEVALLDPESHQKVWGKILEEVNISEWMPGDNWSVDEHKYQIAPPTYHIRKNISIDAPIAKGKYILALTVLDPAGMQPSLRFANENYFEGGYHPMGYIGIGESVADTRLNPDLFFDIQSDKSLKYQFKQPDK